MGSERRKKAGLRHSPPNGRQSPSLLCQHWHGLGEENFALRISALCATLAQRKARAGAGTQAKAKAGTIMLGRWHYPTIGAVLLAALLTAPAAKAQNAGFNAAAAAYLGKAYDTAFAQFQTLADTGLREAQYMLGLMHHQGQATPRNLAKAAEWFFRAARQGEARAQYELGVLYAKGNVVQRDDAQAMKWFLQAAKQGHPQAEYNLAVMYLLGAGVVESSKNAAAWFRRAANQGFADAQYQLGLLYLQGQGAGQDLVEAFKWWTLAADGGSRLAARALNTLAQELSTYELEDAARRVTEWRAQYAPDGLAADSDASAASAAAASGDSIR